MGPRPFPPDHTWHYTRGAAGLWYLHLTNIQSKSYPQAQMSRVRPNPPSWVAFCWAHRRVRRSFISCSLHPLGLSSAKAKYCWALILAGSLNEGKCWERASRKPISLLNLDKVNLTRRYCSYTYSITQTQGRWRLLASNLGLLLLQGPHSKRRHHFFCRLGLSIPQMKVRERRGVLQGAFPHQAFS